MRPLESHVFDSTFCLFFCLVFFSFLGGGGCYCILSVSSSTTWFIQFITGNCTAAQLLTRCGITGEQRSRSTSLLPDIHSGFNLAAVLFPWKKQNKKNSKEKHFKCAYGQDRIIVDDQFCTTMLDVVKKDGVLPWNWSLFVKQRPLMHVMCHWYHLTAFFLSAFRGLIFGKNAL